MLDVLRSYLRYTSWPIIAAMLALMAVGVSAIRVAEQADTSLRDFSSSQIVFACLGASAFVLATVVPYQRLGKWSYALFGLTLLMLMALIVSKAAGGLPGLMPVRDAYRWIDLGYYVKVQPSEIAKVTYVLAMAWYLRYGDHYRRLRGLILPLAMTLVPLALILKEPDLGTSLLLLPTLYFMLFMAGAKLRHLLGIIVLATVVVFMPVPKKLKPSMNPVEFETRKALAYWCYSSGDGSEVALTPAPLAGMEWHQIKRIHGWLRQSDPAVAGNRGYQLHQSKIVLGSGCWAGRGDWKTGPSFFRMLPDDHTDFIFSVIGGQWGFLGCLALIGLYGVIFLFGLEIAVVTYDPFGRLLSAGVLALLFAQICINMGMTMGLMPVTGMTLPLVSYGGSSLVVNCIALGLLVNVGQHRPLLLSRRPFEHGQRRDRRPGVAVR